jgi:probable rRNA maturation factor
MIKVYTKNKQKTIELPAGVRMLVRKACNATLVFENFGFDTEISITFVDDNQIQQLNKQYREKDTPTDVLSFPMFNKDDFSALPKDQIIPLGDIVISAQTAKHQSVIYNHSFEREIAFLTVHSLLHLLGYDHEQSKLDESIMFEKQEEILKTMGLGRD